MTIRWINLRALLSQLGPAVFLGAGAAIGLWLWPTRGDRVQVLLASTLVAFVAMLGLVWQYRRQAARRWSAVVNAYAEQEMARSRLRHAVPARRPARRTVS
jgi:hypothetical protein